MLCLILPLECIFHLSICFHHEYHHCVLSYYYLLPVLLNESGVQLSATTHIGKSQKQKFDEKREGVFYSKAAQSGRMAGFCLKAHTLWKTQK